MHRGFGGPLNPPGSENWGVWAGVVAGLAHPGMGKLFPPTMGAPRGLWGASLTTVGMGKVEMGGRRGVLETMGNRGDVGSRGSHGKPLEKGEPTGSSGELVGTHKKLWGAERSGGSYGGQEKPGKTMEDCLGQGDLWIQAAWEVAPPCPTAETSPSSGAGGNPGCVEG